MYDKERVIEYTLKFLSSYKFFDEQLMRETRRAFNFQNDFTLDDACFELNRILTQHGHLFSRLLFLQGISSFKQQGT